MARRVINTESVTINLPVEQVWSLASSFGGIKAWMPSIKWLTIEGEGMGAVRTVMSLAGIAHEKLEVLDNKNHYISYRILDPIPLPVKGGFGSWKLESIGEEKEKTKVTWVADAEEIDDEGVAFIKPIYAGFMKESLAGFCKALS